MSLIALMIGSILKGQDTMETSLEIHTILKTMGQEPITIMLMDTVKTRANRIKEGTLEVIMQ